MNLSNYPRRELRARQARSAGLTLKQESQSLQMSSSKLLLGSCLSPEYRLCSAQARVSRRSLRANLKSQLSSNEAGAKIILKVRLSNGAICCCIFLFESCLKTPSPRHWAAMHTESRTQYRQRGGALFQVRHLAFFLFTALTS